MTPALTIEGLTARIGELEILKGVDLEVPPGELHVLMGPNGSGKSTLCHVLMGREDYEAEGSAKVNGTEILDRPVDERARLGLFQAFQYPVEVPGVTLDELVEEMARNATDEVAFRARVEEMSERLGMGPFRGRPINVGLSGGEKKRSEMFQLAVAEPRAAVLDEIDSGLDVDAVREIAGLVEELRGPEIGILLITHYSRILRFMRPDAVHVMVAGRIVEAGGPEVAERLDAEGYETFR